MSNMRRYGATVLLLSAFSITATARGQAVTFGPVIGQAHEGAMVGVSPVASADRRSVRVGGVATFSELQGMNGANVPGAVAGGGFRQMAPGGPGLNHAGNVAGNNGFVAGGESVPSASTFAADGVAPGVSNRVILVRPYYYGWGYYPPVVGPLLYDAPFGGLGPGPGYGTVNMLLPMSNSIRYGAGYRR
jgi:hypothetical protein